MFGSAPDAIAYSPTPADLSRRYRFAESRPGHATPENLPQKKVRQKRQKRQKSPPELLPVLRPPLGVGFVVVTEFERREAPVDLSNAGN